MPRLPGQQQQPHYAPAQQPRQQPRQHRQPAFQPAPIPTNYPASTQFNSPVSPLGTPGSVSPTASKNYITRQIRPMYVPAVLRQNEFPSKVIPVRPKPEDEEDDDVPEDGLRPNSSFMNLSGLGAFGRLSRRSTGDSAKCVDGKWDLDQFPKPNGAPTRKHWKPDQESTMCDHATCKRYFSYFTRRHHCRKCGNIFCDQHSAFEIPLDQDANFNPRGIPSRACGHCYAQFKEWRSLAIGSNNGSQESGDVSPDGTRQPSKRLDTPSTPVSTSPTAAGALEGGVPLRSHPEVAHSVPRDWNWSTF
ncbi:Zn finger protein [Collariella sp. IMI 366227]|nr:Zn finger protein [Collariella sp. IMI 366227]